MLHVLVNYSQLKRLTKVLPFLIESIEGIVGTPKSVKNLKSGAFFIRKRSILHLWWIWHCWKNIFVIRKVHSGLNQSKGIFFDGDHDLSDIPDQEIKSVFKEVISDKRFTNKKQILWFYQQIPTFWPLECHNYRQISKCGCNRWKLMFVPNLLR